MLCFWMNTNRYRAGLELGLGLGPVQAQRVFVLILITKAMLSGGIIVGVIKTIMKNKKQLLSSAPWRGDDHSDNFPDGKLKVTNQPGGTSTMYVPRKSSSSKKGLDSKQIDPELRYSFHRNYQFIQRVFSIDTIVKPLPPAMAYNVSRNLSFFTRIFTQFFDPEGIANAQKSLGIGQEEKARRVRD